MLCPYRTRNSMGIVSDVFGMSHFSSGANPAACCATNLVGAHPFQITGKTTRLVRRDTDSSSSGTHFDRSTEPVGPVHLPISRSEFALALTTTFTSTRSLCFAKCRTTFWCHTVSGHQGLRTHLLGNTNSKTIVMIWRNSRIQWSVSPVIIIFYLSYHCVYFQEGGDTLFSYRLSSCALSHAPKAVSTRKPNATASST